ncbi:MAG: radical SAM protein, partial [bacterium]|nr:radical SAM protein [bacterium]
MNKQTSGLYQKQGTQEKILLVLLPFWASFIPPIGIACLKSYLQQHHYEVKTVDANVEIDFTELYDKYFDVIRKNVPKNKQGNFFSIGHDVLRNHLLAYQNYEDENQYRELMKILVAKSFYIDMEEGEVLKLHEIIAEFYNRLEKYLLDLLEKEKPSVLGLSVFSDTLPASMFAFKITRENHPHIKTVMGGGVFADQLCNDSPNLEIFLEKTRPYLDKIIIGEGEILFLKWLRGELPASQRVYTFNDIDRQILDLSSVELLDMTDFDIRNYPYIVSYTSRSCPFQCSFCSETIQWGKYRKKSARKVYEELMELYKRYNTQLFLLSDSLLNPVIHELSEEFLKSGTSIYWEGWLRVDKHVTNVEDTLKWRRSGFYHARLGIESGSEHVLELMGKMISLDQIRTSVSSLAAVGIKTTTLWIVGHPGETEEDFQQTLDLIEELRNDIYEAECRPFY